MLKKSVQMFPQLIKHNILNYNNLSRAHDVFIFVNCGRIVTPMNINVGLPTYDQNIALVTVKVISLSTLNHCLDVLV